LRREAVYRKQSPILICCWCREADVGIPGQVAVELGQRLGEPLPQRIKEGEDLHRLWQYLIIGRPLRLLLPIDRHILTRITERMRAFDPDLLTLERPLELLEDTELIILAVDLDRVVVLFDHRIAPTGEYDTVERHLLREVLPLRPQRLLDGGEGLNDWLKAILAPEGQMLQHPGQHLPLVMDVFLAHDILIPDAVLGPTGLRFRREIPKGLFLDLRKERRADRAVRLLDHRLGDPVQQLHFPRHTLDVLE
jgi:hypothetical protein